MPEKTTIQISFGTMVNAALLVVGLWVVWFLRDVVAILFVSLVLAAALEPWVDYLMKKRVPRIAGVLIIYILLLAILSGLVALLVPPITQELKDLSANVPIAFERISSGLTSFQTFSAQLGIQEEVTKWIQSAERSVASGLGRVVGTVTGFFGGLISFFAVLIITLYLIVEEKAVRKVVTSIAPVSHQEHFSELIIKIERKIGLWLRGQLVLGLIIFVLAFVGLLIFRVPSALVLALFAGFMEFVPVLGPIISAIPAIVLAFGISPLKGLLVLGLYIVIQQIENHVIVPQVMRRALGINPIISLIALLVGAKIAGIIGVLLAIPVATAAIVIVEDFFAHRQATV